MNAQNPSLPSLLKQHLSALGGELVLSKICPPSVQDRWLESARLQSILGRSHSQHRDAFPEYIGSVWLETRFLHRVAHEICPFPG